VSILVNGKILLREAAKLSEKFFGLIIGFLPG